MVGEGRGCLHCSAAPSPQPSPVNTLTQLTLVQFRNYGLAHFSFNAPVTCITGPNGSGKTNLLDAAYYLCYTKSYFTGTQQLLAQRGTDGFRVEGTFEQERREVIRCKWQAGKKEVWAGGVPYERITDHIGKYAAVMIAPDDLLLVNEGSEGRRRWVDSILGQTDRDYLQALLQYSRILQQRNAWLKLQAFNPSSDRLSLEYYDRELDATGSVLHSKRIVFLSRFLPILQPFYEKLSGGREAVSIDYESDLDAKPLAVWLRDSLQQDLRVQRTLHGPHRDDWDFRLDGEALKQFGSQGQKKSFLFALKLAQYAYLTAEQGYLPLLLLDDIFEKLDQGRMEALLKIIRGPGFGQVLLTDTHSGRVKEAFGERAEIGCIELGQ